ncbi:phenylalanine--tRNA ligase subunit alpha [Candidatus Falkowbacteria bacterium]|nr:phenylalanine--tRNA ligase subunit alpha [Candidatus Falkowbacteria bacterium]
MQEKIQQLKEQLLQELEQIKEAQAVIDLQEKYFSKKGLFTTLSKDLKDVADDIRPKVGALLHDVKTQLQADVAQKLSTYGDVLKTSFQDAWIDTSIATPDYKLGNIHPMSVMMQELEDAFSAMGFMTLDGPEIESDYYNFEALNMPSWHPARDSQDTFYVDSKGKCPWVMRTHTSGVQVRAMQKYGAPLRMVAHGRVYRNEATDITHDHTFHQIEGLLIDKNISVAHLIGTLQELISTVYKKDVKIRLRPGYFPFVEPGFELDMYSDELGWVEIGGAGMVHPHVITAGGLDPNEYQGFAFGMGVTRLLMLKYKISDIRLLSSADIRFLQQF